MPGIRDTAVIDLVVEEPDGTIALVILEDGLSESAPATLRQLQSKVNAYLSYALDGQLARDYPALKTRRLRIRVEGTPAPDAAARALIDDLGAQTKARFGIELAWRPAEKAK